MKLHYDCILTRCMAFTFLHRGQTENYFGYTPWDCGLLDTGKAAHRNKMVKGSQLELQFCDNINILY